MRSFVGVFAILLVLCSAAIAQTDRGTITGTVTDPAGAVVANAPLELINVDTGSFYQAASSATGNYTFGQLPVGNYQLTMTVPGFKTYIRQNLRVQTAQIIRVNIQLEVGTAAESVTVTAEASLLRVDNAELATNVTTDNLNNLPILGVGINTASSHGVRNPLAAAQLQPGMTFIANNTIRANGAPSNTMAIRVDGQDATNGVVTFAQSEQQPSVDALEEVSIQTSNYAAEFGQAGAGLFNFTTRSGTNEYHGSLYNYFVNEALWAHQPFDHIRPVTRRNDYGGTIGGPIWIPGVYDGHDKTFFFFNYEEFRESVNVNNQIQTVAIDAYRDGDFSTLLSTGRQVTGAGAVDGLGNAVLEGLIYDPNTTQLAPDGTRVRLPFDGNIVPTSRFDPSAIKIQNLVPRTNLNSELINNWLQPFPSSRVTPIPALKLDHNLSDTMKLSGYWSTTETAVQRCVPLCGSVGLPEPIDNSRGTFIESYTLRANFDWTASPTMLWHFGVGYMNVDFKDTAPVVGYDMLSELGIAGSSDTSQARFPNIDFLLGTGSAAAFGGTRDLGPGGQQRSTENKPTANISLSWVKGDHTLKFGTEMRIEGYPVQNFTFLNGSFDFAGDTNGLSWPTTNPSLQGKALGGRFVGFPYASFLLGAVSQVELRALPAGKAGRQFWSGFAQDTWKATRKLTLDYGLRYDLFTAPVEQYGRTPSFEPSLANPSADGHPGATVFEATCNCTFSKNYKYGFQPRLGMAYQLDDKTVLRAGLGLTYSMSQGSFGQTGTSAGTSLTLRDPQFGDTAMILSQGIPFTVNWPNLDPGIFPLPGTTGPNPTSVDQYLGRPARQYMWQIGLQREIFSNLVVEASYVGNRGVYWRTDDLTQPNALQPEILKSVYGLDWANSATDRAILTSSVNSAAAGRFRNQLPYASFPTGASVAQSLRPFPQFGDIDVNGGPQGKTWYDALQLKATKRLSVGLDFTWTYTYSKELQMGAENDSGGATVNDVFNRDTSKQFSSFSRPHFMVLAMNYTTQQYFGGRIANTLLGDWTFGAVVQYGSGQPIAAPGNPSNNNNSSLLRSTWATRVPGEPLYLVDINCHCYDPQRTQILNPAAWTNTDNGQFSPSARYFNDFRYQRRPQELMSIARIFRIKEGITFTIRAEFNNVFNRPLLRNNGSSSAVFNPSNSLSRVVPLADSEGRFTSGYGTINTTANVGGQRQGTIVARIRF